MGWHPPAILRTLAFDDAEYNLDLYWIYSAQNNTRPGTHRCWDTNPRGTQCCTTIGAFEKVSGTSSGTGEINSNPLRAREKQKSLSESLPYLMPPSPLSNVQRPPVHRIACDTRQCSRSHHIIEQLSKALRVSLVAIFTEVVGCYTILEQGPQEPYRLSLRLIVVFLTDKPSECKGCSGDHSIQLD